MTYTIIFNEKNEPEIRNNTLKKTLAIGDLIRGRSKTSNTYKVMAFTGTGEIVAKIVETTWASRLGMIKTLTRPENYVRVK
jgi:hypothetical protein